MFLHEMVIELIPNAVSSVFIERLKEFGITKAIGVEAVVFNTPALGLAE